MTVEITEQDFYDMRAKRDEALTEVIRAKIETMRISEALTEANALYNTVEAMNLELTERVAQDELAFGFMKEANTRLTEDVARLKADLKRMTSAIEDIKIYGNNPSAWDHYDDEISQKICALVKAAK